MAKVTFTNPLTRYSTMDAGIVNAMTTELATESAAISADNIRVNGLSRVSFASNVCVDITDSTWVEMVGEYAPTAASTPNPATQWVIPTDGVTALQTPAVNLAENEFVRIRYTVTFEHVYATYAAVNDWTASTAATGIVDYGIPPAYTVMAKVSRSVGGVVTDIDNSFSWKGHFTDNGTSPVGTLTMEYCGEGTLAGEVLETQADTGPVLNVFWMVKVRAITSTRAQIGTGLGTYSPMSFKDNQWRIANGSLHVEIFRREGS